MSTRDELIQAATTAIFREEGPECIDDDGADALATVAIDAVLPLIADAIQARVDTGERLRSFAPPSSKGYWLGYSEGAASVRNLVRSLSEPS